MRIAVLSDIHGNLTALEAVVADLRETSPDLVLHGGDLADAGASPVEIVDRVRDRGWQGVLGNTDEMLFRPESLQEFASQSPAHLQALFAAVEEMATVTRELLGGERLAWLRALPLQRTHGPMTLVHARPETPWRAPAPEASDAELESVYGALGPMAVYGHIHRPFVRRVSGLIVANCGSVGLPHDGDRRAAYLLLDDDSEPVIRRVEYDVAKELGALSQCGLPHADWVARILETARPRMP